MDKFETVIILKPTIDQGKRNQVITQIEEFINEIGTLTRLEELEEKKLAYEVQGHKFGYYVVLEFDADSSFKEKLEKRYKEIEEIIKFIVVRRDE